MKLKLVSNSSFKAHWNFDKTEHLKMIVANREIAKLKTKRRKKQ